MRSKIFQTTKDYAGRSSIHGIGYIFDKDFHLVDRLLWLLLVIVFGGVAATLTWDFWFHSHYLTKALWEYLGIIASL